MTAAAHPATSGRRGVVVVDARLFVALLAIAESRMVGPKDGPKHPGILSTQEFLGICNARHWRSGCGPTCQSMTATLAAARSLLDEALARGEGREMPVQLELIREAV